MQEKRVWFALGVALLTVLSLLALAARGNSGNSQTSNGVSAASPNAIRISIASSSTKQTWLHQAVDTFNLRSKYDGGLQFNGRPIYVDIIQEKVDGQLKDYRSGTMVADTLQGKIKPTIVSPSDESWLLRLNKEWKSTNGKTVVNGDTPSLARTPVVIAMWQSRAMALNSWPETGPGIGWQTIHDLAVNPDGWGMVGKPQWGKFKFGYGYVGESNSGTLSAALMCMVGAKKTDGLAMEDVNAEGG